MKGSITIVSLFVIGVILSRMGLLHHSLVEVDYTLYILYVLLFFVGVTIGHDSQILNSVKSYGWRILLVPAATIIGTLLGCLLFSFALPGRSVSEWLAVGSGFGYYSLSTVFITQLKGAELGTVALLSNILRELITLLCAPLLVRYFGRLGPICSGGATTMDTTLPIITRYSGHDFVVIAIFHGFVVDFSVPFLVTLFASI